MIECPTHRNNSNDKSDPKWMVLQKRFSEHRVETWSSSPRTIRIIAVV
jgi:hypothetical protein